MKIKKLIATVLAATMIIGTMTTAFAEDPAPIEVGSGQGTIDVLPDDIIAVTVPTNVSYDFDIDGSQQLHASDSSYEEARLIFAATKKSSSSILTVTSKSTTEIDIEVYGEIKNASGENGEAKIGTEEAKAANADTTPTIDLTINECNVEGEDLNPAKDVVYFKGDGSTFATGQLESYVDEYDAVRGTPNEDHINKWSYELKSEPSAPPKAIYFVVKGDATREGENIKWSTIKKVPTLSVTYKIKKGGSYVENTATGPAKVDGTKINGKSNAALTGSVLDAIKAGAVVFRFDTSANDPTGLSVTDIKIDGTSYSFTAGDNTKVTDDSDGKAYTITGVSASSISTVEVYYADGEDVQFIVKYSIS